MVFPAIRRHPGGNPKRSSLRLLQLLLSTLAGFSRGEEWSSPGPSRNGQTSNVDPSAYSHQNPLAHFFWNRQEAPGIWKWAHYFEAELAENRTGRFYKLQRGEAALRPLAPLFSAQMNEYQAQIKGIQFYEHKRSLCPISQPNTRN